MGPHHQPPQIYKYTYIVPKQKSKLNSISPNEKLANDFSICWLPKKTLLGTCTSPPCDPCDVLPQRQSQASPQHSPGPCQRSSAANVQIGRFGAPNLAIWIDGIGIETYGEGVSQTMSIIIIIILLLLLLLIIIISIGCKNTKWWKEG